MKKILLTATCVLCAVAFSLSTAFADDPNESDGNDGGLGAYVTCKCAGVLGNSDCKASNKQSVCGGGDNFDCSTLNSNC